MARQQATTSFFDFYTASMKERKSFWGISGGRVSLIWSDAYLWLMIPFLAWALWVDIIFFPLFFLEELRLPCIIAQSASDGEQYFVYF
jgi:hypothetical protein